MGRVSWNYAHFDSFAVKVEWMEMQQFREEYGGGIGILGTSVPGSPVEGAGESLKCKEKNSLNSKRLDSGSQAKTYGTNSKAEAKQSGSRSSGDSSDKQGGAKTHKQLPGNSGKTCDQESWFWSCRICRKDFQAQQALDQHQRILDT